jgi:prepilin-type N-terminal cleavage/methylation domain-containing protein
MIKIHNKGFTIVELLIVIVVIGILAAITIVAYSGIQARARDSIRQEDATTITKALELYYIDKGYYPNATKYTPGSTAINSGWSTTTDGSWSNLVAVLNPYVSKLPSPPGSSSLTPAVTGGNNYDYFGFSDSSYCGSSAGQGYLLVYKQEGTQTNSLNGNCTGTPVGPYGAASNYRMVK